MSRYRRVANEGGWYFFTVVLADRSTDLLVKEIDLLRGVYAQVQRKHSFETAAICILPDHLHAVWVLPEGDDRYPLRWSLIKAGFSRALPVAADRSPSKIAKRDKGIWQRRYWEHTIRDERDLERHVDDVDYNPVKHGLVADVADWPHSSFHRDVRRGIRTPAWRPDAGSFEGYFGEE